MPTLDLGYCMRLAPEKAVEYLQSKGYEVSWDWEELWQDAHANAFTVAKATRLDILQDIREAVQTALNEGKTLAWFAKELTPVLQAKGWWGKQEHVDERTGEITDVQLGSPWRLRTIFRTNVQTAYMAGRYAGQMENVDDRPYWQYVAILDTHTRPSHRALNGRVFRYDDPFWQSFYPPNGWGCRCRVTTRTEDEIATRRLTVETSEGKLGTVLRRVSEKTDALREVATYRAIDPTTGKAVVVSPDVGWSYNPGAAAWQADTTRYTGELAALAKQELGKQDKQDLTKRESP
jgi:SPP1 gp7 family putative phage head morphogenesis protein